MSQEELLNVGGQAVLEGVMMRSPQALAVAVRLPDGSVVLKDEPFISLTARYPLFKKPLLRGPVILIEALVTGVQALTFSAQAALGGRRNPAGLGEPRPHHGGRLSPGLSGFRPASPLPERLGRPPPGLPPHHGESQLPPG